MDLKARERTKYRLLKPVLAALVILALIGAAAWAGRNRIAVELAPRKHLVTARGEAALKADELFWQTFHAGDYGKIAEALEKLTAAYLQTPEDAVTAAHVAWLHTWRSSERARLATPPATVTDDLVLARKYFQEAVALDPTDARYLGFLAGMTLAEGNVHHDERLVRQGYFTLLDAIKAWPEFNLFTAGYIMSRQPAGSAEFQQGLEWEWRNLDECTGATIDRANPDYSQYMRQETKEGRKRVCWNSWIAPHNFEGFFLNMGDMLVKSGDWQTAQKIYANAKLAAEYRSWSYAPVLEDRIANAQANVAVFTAPTAAPMNRIMFESPFSCMACHKQ